MCEYFFSLRAPLKLRQKVAVSEAERENPLKTGRIAAGHRWNIFACELLLRESGIPAQLGVFDHTF
jgi:hypothetical protein